MNLRACIAALGVIAAPASYSQDVGAVKVRVILKSNTVKDLLPKVPDAERAAALEIVRKIGVSAEMSFVRWLPEHSKAPAAARLTVTLFDKKPIAPDLPADHFVSYEAEILAPEGKDVRPLVSEYGRGEKLFTKREEQKKLGNTSELAEALADIVEKQLAARRPQFLATFLYKVPLSRTKPTLEDDGTVVVALPWDALGASETSVLWIDIAAKPPAQRQEQKGLIVLEELLACPQPSCSQPSTRGTAKKFKCYGIGDVPPDPWDKVVGPVRDGLKSHVVYMKTYIPSYSGTTPAGVFDEFGDGK